MFPRRSRWHINLTVRVWFTDLCFWKQNGVVNNADKSSNGKRKSKRKLFYVYGSVHHNKFYEITNRCSHMQSILFHC